MRESNLLGKVGELSFEANVRLYQLAALVKILASKLQQRHFDFVLDASYERRKAVLQAFRLTHRL